MSNVLTRIKNNQITDSTILANTKIVPGSIVGSLFNSNLTMTSDVTITGNLIVQGASTYLTVASTNTYVNDPLIVLNNAFSGTNTYDIGLVINRGNQTSTALIWEETAGEFQLTYTTDPGTTYGTINNSGFANLHIGNLNVQYATTLGSLATSGNISGWYGSLSGNLLIGGGSLVANTTSFNLLNSTVTNLSFGGAVTTANVGAATGTFTLNNPILVGSQPTQAVYNTVATTVNAFGAATALNLGAATGIATVNNANVWVPNATSVDGAQTTVNLFTQNATTLNVGNAATTLNLGANSGTVFLNGANVALLNATTIYTGQTSLNFANTNVTSANLLSSATSISIGAAAGGTMFIRSQVVNGSSTSVALWNSVSTGVQFAGAATALTIGATTGVANIRNANIYFPNATTIYSGQTSLTFANTVTTSLGIGGATTTLNLGGANGTTNLLGNLTVQSTLDYQNPGLNSVVVNGGINVLKTAFFGGNTIINVTTPSTTNATGALQVAGGLGVGQSIYARDINNTVIGNTSAAAGTFTNLTSTGTTSLNLTTAVAINNTPIGNATASTGAFTTLTASGITTITGTTPANNLGGGVLQVSGGASVQGNLWVGGNLNIIGNSYVVTSNSGVFYGNAVGAGALYAGVAGYTPQPFTTVQSTGNANNFIQINNQNINNGSNASTDFVATMDTGNTTQGYIDMGINSSGFTNGAGNELNYPGDGYLYVQGNVTTGSGNLLISTGLANDIVFSLNGQGSANEIARFNYAQNALLIKSTTASTNTTSGALQVAGGVGIQGNLNVGGNLVTNGATTHNNTLTATGAISFTNTTNSTSTSAGGALTVGGGAAFAKDVWIGGNLYVANVVSQTNTILVVQDPLLYLQGNVTYPYSFDIGFYSHFIGGPANIYAHTGVVRDNADNTWKFFSNVAEPSAGTVTFDSNTIYDPIKAGNLTLTVTTNATNNSTGALQVSGGAGIGASLYARDIQATVIGNVTPAAATFTALTSQSTTTLGAVSAASINNTVIGNVTPANGDFTRLAATGIVYANSATTSTSATTGGLIVAGGIGASGNVFITGNYIDTSSSTLTAFATPTTASVLSSATSLTLGAGTGIATVNNANIWVPNATTLNGAASSIALFNNALTVTLGTGATSLSMGSSSGTATINNGTLSLVNATAVTTLQPTIALLNTSVTTMNFAGAATSLNVGAATGTLSLNNANIALPNATTIYTGQTTLAFANTNVTAANLLGSATSISIGAVSGFTYLRSNNVLGDSAVQNLWNTVATTIGFAGSATQITIGATTGLANIRNANIYFPNATTIYSGQTTLDIANVNVTTLGIGGAATALNLGATTGVTTINNNLSTSGILYANSATSSTNYTTGAIVVPGQGGIGVGGNIYVQNGIQANGLILTGNVNSASYTQGSALIHGGMGITGNINMQSGAQLIVGQDVAGGVILPSATAQFFSNANSYSQINQQNVSTGTQASSDFIATANNGDDTKGYIDLGINGSNFNSSTFTIAGPDDGYLYVQGNSTAGFGDLAIGTGTALTDVIFFTGGTLAANEIARFSNVNENFNIKTGTNSTSPTTGALVVAGGAGIGGNVWVAGGAVFNQSQSSYNFVVEGATSTGLIFADSNNAAVTVGGGGVGGSGSVTTTLGASFKVAAQDTMMLPVGTSAQRPSSSGNVDIAGMIRFNSTISNMEFFDGSNWQTSGSSFTIISDRQFSSSTGNPYGNVDGTNTSFTIQSSATTSGTIVSINGVLQLPTVAYSVSGTTLTFTEAPSVGDIIDVRVLTTTATVSTLASGNGLNQFIADSTGASIWTGTSFTIEQILVDTAGNMNLLTGNDINYNQVATNIPAASTPYVVDTFSQTAFTTSKYIVQIKKDTTNMQSMEAMVLTDGAGNAYLSVYGVINNGTALGTLSANVVSGNVNLYYTSSSVTNSNVKVQATRIV